MLGRLFIGRDALELRREHFDPAGGIDQALFSGVGGMRIHGHVANHNVILHAIDLLLAGGLHRGLGEETFARCDIEEANVVKSGMDFGFHGDEKG
jgi:hypothetical protein